MQKLLKDFGLNFMISGFFPDHGDSILLVVSSRVYWEFSGNLTISKQGHAPFFGATVTSTRIYF